MRRLVAGTVVALVLAGSALPAQANAVRCEITASPQAPGAQSEAFARDDVRFSTAVHVQCFDVSDAPAAASQVCLSAWRNEVSGSAELLGNSQSVPYRVVANAVDITTIERQIWSGAIDATGSTLNVDYEVPADGFAGFPAGTYFATTTWATYLDQEVCG